MGRQKNYSNKDNAFLAGLTKAKSDIEGISAEAIETILRNKKKPPSEEYILNYVAGYKAGKEFLIINKKSPFYYFAKHLGANFAVCLKKNPQMSLQKFMDDAEEYLKIRLHKVRLKIQLTEEDTSICESAFKTAVQTSFENCQTGKRRKKQAPDLNLALTYGKKRLAEEPESKEIKDEIAQADLPIKKRRIMPQTTDYPAFVYQPIFVENVFIRQESLPLPVIPDPLPILETPLPSFRHLEANLSGFYGSFFRPINPEDLSVAQTLESMSMGKK